MVFASFGSAGTRGSATGRSGGADSARWCLSLCPRLTGLHPVLVSIRALVLVVVGHQILCALSDCFRTFRGLIHYCFRSLLDTFCPFLDALFCGVQNILPKGRRNWKECED